MRQLAEILRDKRQAFAACVGGHVEVARVDGADGGTACLEGGADSAGSKHQDSTAAPRCAIMIARSSKPLP